MVKSWACMLHLTMSVNHLLKYPHSVVCDGFNLSACSRVLVLYRLLMYSTKSFTFALVRASDVHVVLATYF